MDSHAGDVWKTRALDAENALRVALIELTASRGSQLVLKADLRAAEETIRTQQLELAAALAWSFESAASIERVRAVCADPPTPSRMLIPYILHALNWYDE